MPDLDETKHADYNERVELLVQQCVIISERPDRAAQFLQMAEETINSLTQVLFEQISADVKEAFEDPDL